MTDAPSGQIDRPIPVSWSRSLLDAPAQTRKVNDWFDREDARPVLPPGLLAAWFIFSGIAVGGSIVFGASIAMRLPDWDPLRGGLWVLVASGLSWFVLGPGCWWLLRRPLLTVAHLCMVTMVWGIIPLLAGACVNLALFTCGLTTPDATSVAFTAVGISNVGMAYVFAMQWRAIRVSPIAALIAWIVLLDGTGAAFFYMFHRLFFAGGAA